MNHTTKLLVLVCFISSYKTAWSMATVDSVSQALTDLQGKLVAVGNELKTLKEAGLEVLTTEINRLQAGASVGGGGAITEAPATMFEYLQNLYETNQYSDENGLKALINALFPLLNRKKNNIASFYKLVIKTPNNPPLFSKKDIEDLFKTSLELPYDSANKAILEKYISDNSLSIVAPAIPTIKPSKPVTPPPSGHSGGGTGTLVTPSTDARFTTYAKMQSMNIPNGAIRQKMTTAGWNDTVIDAFFAGTEVSLDGSNQGTPVDGGIGIGIPVLKKVVKIEEDPAKLFTCRLEPKNDLETLAEYLGREFNLNPSKLNEQINAFFSSLLTDIEITLVQNSIEKIYSDKKTINEIASTNNNTLLPLRRATTDKMSGEDVKIKTVPVVEFLQKPLSEALTFFSDDNQANVIQINVLKNLPWPTPVITQENYKPAVGMNVVNYLKKYQQACDLKDFKTLLTQQFPSLDNNQQEFLLSYINPASYDSQKTAKVLLTTLVPNPLELFFDQPTIDSFNQAVAQIAYEKKQIVDMPYKSKPDLIAASSDYTPGNCPIDKIRAWYVALNVKFKTGEKDNDLKKQLVTVGLGNKTVQEKILSALKSNAAIDSNDKTFSSFQWLFNKQSETTTPPGKKPPTSPKHGTPPVITPPSSSKSGTQKNSRADLITKVLNTLKSIADEDGCSKLINDGIVKTSLPRINFTGAHKLPIKLELKNSIDAALLAQCLRPELKKLLQDYQETYKDDASKDLANITNCLTLLNALDTAAPDEKPTVLEKTAANYASEINAATGSFKLEQIKTAITNSDLSSDEKTALTTEIDRKIAAIKSAEDKPVDETPVTSTIDLSTATELHKYLKMKKMNQQNPMIIQMIKQKMTTDGRSDIEISAVLSCPVEDIPNILPKQVE